MSQASGEVETKSENLEDPKGEVCTICQDVLVDKMYRLKCGHLVHDNCILDSFQNSCKSPMQTETFIRRKHNGIIVSETLGEFKCPLCRNCQFVAITQKIPNNDQGKEEDLIAKIVISNNIIEKKLNEIWIQKPSQILKIGQKIKNVTGTFDIINQMFRADTTLKLHLTANKFIIGDLDPKMSHMTLDQFYRLFLKKITGNQCRPCPFTAPRDDNFELSDESSDS